MSQPQRSPGALRVVLLMGLLVLIILAIDVVSALVPGLDSALAALPIVMGVLVLGTAVILVRSLVRRG
jgi:hypothetical protein